jgi:putative exosortase-associated protein (TIGR04073 family)
MRLPKSTLLLAVMCLPMVIDGGAECRADIHDPPMVSYGPIRKLGRGIGNLAFGGTEIYNSLDDVNLKEGNSSAGSYGLVRGVTRTLTRMGAGVFEIVTWPFPTTRGTYEPILRQPVPWMQRGFEDFPPELGFETRMDYCRIQTIYTRLP